MNPKYVIIQMNEYDTEVKICSAVENHCDQVPFHLRENVIAAGEFQLGINVEDGQVGVACFGKSTTLGKESRGAEDERLIRQMLRLGEFAG